MSWILRDHVPVMVPFREYVEWMKAGFDQTKRVAVTQVGEARVSTVFLSIDHNWGGGEPILFETMIFGGDHDDWQDRYHTWDEAMAGHDRVVAALQAGLEP